MIWLIASLIAGIALKVKAVVLLVMAYLVSRKSRDLALLIYFFYGVLLVNEIQVVDFISYESLKSLSIVVPSIAVLGEILRGAELEIKLNPLQLIGIAVLAAGVLYGYLLPAGIILLIAGKGVSVKALKSIIIGVTFLLLMLWILKTKYPYLYTPENQVSIIAGITILLMLKQVRNLRKVEFKLKIKS